MTIQDGVDTADLDPTVRYWMVWLITQWEQQTGVPVTITSGYRSIAKQTALYNDRANNPNPVNRPGDSAHNYGLAFDSWVPAEAMDAWKQWREWIGFRVPANDLVHAEVPNWRNYVK